VDDICYKRTQILFMNVHSQITKNKQIRIKFFSVCFVFFQYFELLKKLIKILRNKCRFF
jgi:hypothetical protein